MASPWGLDFLRHGSYVPSGGVPRASKGKEAETARPVNAYV